MTIDFDGTPESNVSPKPPRELDPSIYKPSPTELEFLQKTVSSDENEIKRRVLDVQQKCGLGSITLPVAHLPSVS